LSGKPKFWVDAGRPPARVLVVFPRSNAVFTALSSVEFPLASICKEGGHRNTASARHDGSVKSRDSAEGSSFSTRRGATDGFVVIRLQHLADDRRSGTERRDDRHRRELLGGHALGAGRRHERRPITAQGSQRCPIGP